MLAYGNRPNAIKFAWANNSDLLQALKHLMVTRLNELILCCQVVVNWSTTTVRVAQLEEVWSPRCVKLTKSLQQAFKIKIAGFFGSRPKLGGLAYHNISVGTLKSYLYLTRIGCLVLSAQTCCAFDPLDYTDSFRSGRYWELGHL